MKKILFLIQDLGGGGAERVLVNLANNLDKTKFDVTIQTIFDIGVNLQDLHDDVKYKPGLKKQIKGNVFLFRMIPRSVLYNILVGKNSDYDIVIGFLEGSVSRIISGCTNKDSKKIAWIHTDERNESYVCYAFGGKRKAEKCYNKMDNIVCVSKSVMDGFKSILEINTNIEVLYNVNETDQIKVQAVEDIENDFYDDSINIVSVGRLIDVKGYDRLINIHKRLLDDGIKNKVFIFGTGEKEEQLQKQIKDLGVESSFILMGYSRNPYKYVSKANLFVCSSRREGFSTAVTEALLCGTPVVSTNVSGAYELLGYNNEYGIVTDNNENALYEGILEMLTEDNLVKYKKLATQRGNAFDKSITVDAIENMFDNI